MILLLGRRPIRVGAIRDANIDISVLPRSRQRWRRLRRKSPAPLTFKLTGLRNFTLLHLDIETALRRKYQVIHQYRDVVTLVEILTHPSSLTNAASGGELDPKRLIFHWRGNRPDLEFQGLQVAEYVGCGRAHAGDGAGIDAQRIAALDIPDSLDNGAVLMTVAD